MRQEGTQRRSETLQTGKEDAKCIDFNWSPYAGTLQNVTISHLWTRKEGARRVKVRRQKVKREERASGQGLSSSRRVETIAFPLSGSIDGIQARAAAKLAVV